MTVAEILEKLKALRVHLRAEGERLILDAPKGCLSPELKEHIMARKRELLAALRPPGSQAGVQVEWLAEVRVMRNGDSSDWAAWSPVCRQAWARQMIELAQAEGCYQQAPADCRAWLEKVAEGT